MTEGKRLSILASCMTNLSKFYIVFSSSALIRLNKDTFEWHLCQTVNNFVKQNKSSLLSPLRKRRPPQPISISETLEYLVYLLLTNLAARRCTLQPYHCCNFGVGPRQWRYTPLKSESKKSSSLLKLLWEALQVATKKKLEVTLVCHGCNMF